MKVSVLGRNVFVHAGSDVRDSVLLDNVYVGPRAHVRRAIIDKNVRIGANQAVGYDIEQDRLHYHVSDTGIVVIPKAAETPETRERQLLRYPTTSLGTRPLSPHRLNEERGSLDAIPRRTKWFVYPGSFSHPDFGVDCGCGARPHGGDRKLAPDTSPNFH